MGGQFVTAAFFVPLAARPPDDAALFETIAPGGALGPLDAQAKYINVLSHHVCVQLKFLRVAFLDLIEERAVDMPLEDDSALPLALALRDGAVRARAEVAMLVQEAHVQEELLDRYDLILSRDLNGLVAESYPLLYLSDAVARGWTLPDGQRYRDELPGGPGRTIFADGGEDRWL